MTSGCKFCCQLGKLDVWPCLWLPCDVWTWTRGRVWIWPDDFPVVSSPVWKLFMRRKSLLVLLESLQTNLAALRCTASNVFVVLFIWVPHRGAVFQFRTVSSVLFSACYTNILFPLQCYAWLLARRNFNFVENLTTRNSWCYCLVSLFTWRG